MKTLFVLMFLMACVFVVYPQCIDKDKVKAGGDYGFVKYMFLRPTYTFAYNGDTSKNWNALNKAIDIKQAPEKAMIYKNHVEKTIKRYAGLKFYSDLRFINVEILYPGKFQALKDSGRTDVLYRYAKAQYFYFYQFGPNDTAVYLIGIAVNKKGKIISQFMFPPKEYYKPIDKTFT